MKEILSGRQIGISIKHLWNECKITSLIIENADEVELRLDELRVVETLENLVIRNVGKGIDSKTLGILLRKCPNLKFLELENINARSIDVTNLKKLKNLTIKSNNQLRAIYGISNLASLTTLYIDDNDSLELTGFLRLETLENLVIRNVGKGIDSKTLGILLRKCPNLKFLELENINARIIDVSSLKKLVGLQIRSNQYLKSIRGIANLENISDVTIYDNYGLEFENICKDLVKISKAGTFLNLDVLMYPEMQNAKSLKENFEWSTVNFSWSEMINRQRDYTHRKERNEQKCTYEDIKMKEIDDKADEIINKYIDDKDSDELKFTILYDYMIKKITYDHDALKKEDRMEYVKGKLNANGMGAGFLRETCVCEGYSRMLQYLLSKCGIKSEEVDCLTNQEAIKNKSSALDHSMIKVCLNRGTYFCDPTWDAGKKEYKYYLLSKDEMLKKRIVQEGDEFDVTNTAISDKEKRELLFASKSRISSVIIGETVNETKQTTRTGSINKQVSQIKTYQQNQTNEINKNQEVRG